MFRARLEMVTICMPIAYLLAMSTYVRFGADEFARQRRLSSELYCSTSDTWRKEMHQPIEIRYQKTIGLVTSQHWAT